jgi:hypothetical protein
MQEDFVAKLTLLEYNENVYLAGATIPDFTSKVSKRQAGVAESFVIAAKAESSAQTSSAQSTRLATALGSVLPSGVAALAPRYLGFDLYPTALEGNEGDTILQYSDTASECGVYLWVTDSWVRQASPTPAMIASAWVDITALRLTQPRSLS